MSDYEQFSELKRLCGAFLLLSFRVFFLLFPRLFQCLLCSLLQVLSHECKRLLHRLPH